MWYKRHKDYNSRYFIFFIWYVFVIEIGASYPLYLREFTIFKPIKTIIEGTALETNPWWYNVFWTLGSVLFICFYIHRILITDPFKRIVAWISFGYLLFYLIYNLIHSENFFNGNDMGSFIIGGAVVVISISLYFIELLAVDRVMDFKSSFNLIVLGALFIWWLVIAPTLFYEEYFNVVDLGFLNLRKQILFSCNVLMYGMFSFALAYCKPQNH